MKRWWAPSLLRRVSLAMLLVIGLTWLWSIALNFALHRQGEERENRRWTEQAGAFINRFAVADDATWYLQWQADYYHRNFGKTPLLSLQTPAGKPVFVSRAGLDCPTAARDGMKTGGKTYRAHYYRGARWHLCVAFPVLDLPEFVAIELVSLSQQIGIGVLLVVPVCWLSVAGCLSLLARLSKRLESRASDDLSPLDFDTQYREIVPLVGAIDGLLLRLRNRIAYEQAFVENAAHELRTPLAVIMTQKEVLAHAPDRATREQARQQIGVAVARARHLTGQMAELVLLDREQGGPVDRVDLAQLTEMAVAQMQALAQARGMVLSCRIEPHLQASVERDSGMSILINLIDNAIRYGKALGKIEVELRKQDGTVQLTVADDGPGIAPEQRERVFERFYRGIGHEVRGSGLGLSIVRQAVQRQKGAIRLADGIGGAGCCFVVDLPFVPAPLPESEANGKAVWEAGAVPKQSNQQRQARVRGGVAVPIARLRRLVRRVRSFWQRPSLFRRSFFAVLLAYPVLWMILLVNHYVKESGALEKNTPRYLAQDIALLNHFATADEVVAFMQNAVQRYRCFADIPVDVPPHFVEVWNHRQQKVFFEPNKPYPPTLLADGARSSGQAVVEGVAYVIERRDGPNWSLRVARPDITLWQVIQRDAFNLSLLVGLLFSIPLVMLPIWLALALAFRPLRQLAMHLSRQSALNFALPALDVKYIELVPVMQALDSLLSRLSAKTLQEQRFVEEAARALQAPMAMIEAEVARLAVDTGNGQRENGQKIASVLADAARLIHQLLELARIDGTQARAVQQLDLVALVQVDLAQWADLAWQHDIELTLEMPDKLSFALEKSPFQLILHNLVDNAIRYGRAGGRVEVELYRDQAALVLAVSDDGPGIAAENAERVFERFWRGDHDDHAAARGAGLGLAIVRQAAARLGAGIELGSGIDGRGCRFVLRFPAKSGTGLTGQAGKE